MDHYTTPQELAALHKRGAQCLDGPVPVDGWGMKYDEHSRTPALSNLRPPDTSRARDQVPDGCFMRRVYVRTNGPPPADQPQGEAAARLLQYHVLSVIQS